MELKAFLILITILVLNSTGNLGKSWNKIGKINRMACSDQLGEERCDKLFQKNKCKGPNEDKMSYNCAKTCKKCPNLPNRMACSDRLGSKRCVTYTNNGNRCNGIYEKRMTFNCKKTCKKCLGKYKVGNITKYLNAVLQASTLNSHQY